MAVTYNNNAPNIQKEIAELGFKIQDFVNAIGDVVDAVETYRGMENIDNEKYIRDFESANIPYFRQQKNELYQRIRSFLGSIQ